MRRIVPLVAVVSLATIALGWLVLARNGIVSASPPWSRAAAPAELVLSGNVEAHESALSFQGVQSRVVQLPFDEGRSVRQGDTLAVVDSQDQHQQVAIADAAVAVQLRQLETARQNVEAARRAVEADRAELAQRELDRRRALALQQQGFVSQASLDVSDTALAQTRAVLARDQALEEVARRNIAVSQAGARSAQETAQLSRIVEGFTTLRAPFDGVILARQAELGEVVAPGTPIVTLADLDHVWIRAYLNETDVARVRLGQAAKVTTDTYPDRPLAGRLSFIAPQAEFTPRSVETHAERVSLVYRVRIDVDNPAHLLVPGMPVDVRLVVARP